MRDGTPVTLYCFAHAGAGVSGFAHWRAGTGPGVVTAPVLLPGRESRRREPRARTRDELLAALLGPLADEVADGRPYAFYGHSLGGIVAHTLARALVDRGLPAPGLLAVGASPAPHTVPVRQDDDITDERLLRFVADLGAAPGGALADPGSVWHRSVLPVLRDDLVLAAALRTAALTDPASGPLPVPVLAVGGRDDPVVHAAALDGWARWTTGRFVRRTVPGDHFFVRGPHAPRLIGRACRVVRRTRLVPGLISGGQL
ncbi:thioesterase II family protein [Streptomyces albogriseolus]|uniref:thioesterase II family protein n=1 Tax=Streptomyces albogriseolus TaxID=1887 RepID=UPI0033A9F2CC